MKQDALSLLQTCLVPERDARSLRLAVCPFSDEESVSHIEQTFDRRNPAAELDSV